MTRKRCSVYYLFIPKYEPVADMVKYIHKHWAMYSPYIRTGRKLIIFYNITILFLLLEEWKKALVWLESILHFGVTQKRKDIQGAARILQLIFFYELEIGTASRIVSIPVNAICAEMTSCFCLKKRYLTFFVHWVDRGNVVVYQSIRADFYS